MKNWKRRNTIVHGGIMARSRVIYEINLNLYHMDKVRYPWLKNILATWPHIVQFLEGYRPHVVCRPLQWRCPPQGHKCNTDGASTSNPGLSSIAFCIRNNRDDFIYACASRIVDITNICAEAKPIWDGIEHCVMINLCL
ncbi:hypothetical protein RND71_031978 [Anisodus tanguticus]|uniref:Uncharacterized protein n=1 Tax=Anisodus tanguticus TaxID=243964 RepID=A0AAE1UXZ3_9SOLA|nr:hypothetical protein RND71_031978 [Anisodus tanguticus]